MPACERGQSLHYMNKGESNKVSTAIATQSEHQDYAAIVERVLATGDLAKLSSAERVNYFNAVCQSRRGSTRLTQPLQYITLNGKLTLYVRRDATDQLRNLAQRLNHDRQPRAHQRCVHRHREGDHEGRQN